MSLPQWFPNLASPKKQLVATVPLPLMEILYTLENIANTHQLLFVMRTTKICFAPTAERAETILYRDATAPLASMASSANTMSNLILSSAVTMMIIKNASKMFA